MHFRSKIGAIIVVPAAVVVLLGAPAAAQAVVAGRPFLAAILTLPIGLVTWVLLSTRYTITTDHLAIRCAFVTFRIPLQSITKVRPTRTVLSAPALSLDRLEVTHDAGIAVISPAHAERFLAELRARCPRAEIRVV